jgi:dsRNA-specific ribonuclease
MYLATMSHKLNTGATVYADLLDAANCHCWWGRAAFSKARECVSAIAKSTMTHEKLKKWREQSGTGFHQALMAGCMSFISWLVCQDAMYAEKLRTVYVVVMDAAAKAFLEHEVKMNLKKKEKSNEDIPIPQDILGYLTGKKSTKDHNPINALQEKCQLMRWPLPRYSAVQVAGQGYKVEVRVPGHNNIFGWGMGFAKQDAKVEAARMACACFDELPMPKSSARVLDDPRQSRRFQQIIGLLNTDRINAVSGLQEMCQFFKWDMPVYTLSTNEHPPYECEVKIVVCLFGELSAYSVKCTGDSKKKAKEESAAKAIETICNA